MGVKITIIKNITYFSKANPFAIPNHDNQENNRSFFNAVFNISLHFYLF
jgi:hypothetical protein